MSSNVRRVVMVVVAAVAVILVVLFWRPLAGWFSGDARTPEAPRPPAAHAHGAEAPAGPVTGTPLSPESLPYVEAAFGAYEGIRDQLARDRLEQVAHHAAELAAALRRAQEAAGKDHLTLAAALEAAEALRVAEGAEAMRARFGQLSQALIALAAAEPSLQEGWNVFRCPMTGGTFDKWFQRGGRMENPYMGRRMLACGSPTEWKVEAAPAPSAPKRDEVSHYTCPMHPSVRSETPGSCPLCGMHLVPVSREDVHSGVVHVDEATRQRIGVKIQPVAVEQMELSFRALGRVTWDESALQDVTLKLDGYVQSLRVNATGQPVKRGEVLFTLYSPELFAAQQELLLALGSQSEANASLVRAARKRLQLWGLTPAQIDRIAQRGEPSEYVPFFSPATGYVLEKNVVEGAAVKAGERLFRIAPLQKVWVEAEVYEQDLPQLRVGLPVEVTLPYLPRKPYQGKVAYLYPTLDSQTRTARVRVELPNPELQLKPDMYADVHFVIAGERLLQVPKSAVLYTGPRRLVFVDLGDGRLQPREVKLGREGNDSFEVLAGLSAGDRVVISGNFLLAAESRIRSASELWNGGDHGGH